MSAPKLSSSIRGKLLLGFFAMSVITAGLGACGIYGIVLTGRIVVETYDKPLMAINFARSASLAFSQMEKELLLIRQAADAAETHEARLEQLGVDLVDDLRVAEARSLSAGAVAMTAELRRLLERWNALRLASPVDPALDPLGHEVMDRFDLLIERTTNDSFVERQRAVGTIGMVQSASIAATVAALLSAAAIALALSRRITGPLTAAASVADRIAGGELQTPIPPGGADETGALLRSMIVMQDSIRVMMQREAARLHSAETRLVDALESSEEAMMLIDADDRLVIANSQVARFVPDFAARLVPGVAFSKVFAGPPTESGLGARQSLFLLGGEAQLTNGRWLRVSRSATRDGGYFLLWSDITDLKEREEALRTAMMSARAASAAKTNFLSNISHELRTPLNAIIGFSEIIHGEMFGPLGNARYVEYAGDILESGRHLLGIINSVLDLVKSEAGKLSLVADSVQLARILEDCARTIAGPCARAGLDFEFSPPGAELQVWGDPTKLRQAFLNLLSNAIKFSPSGGRVSLTAAQDDDGYVRVSVRDTGIGMRPDDIRVALEPFGQVDSDLTRRFEGAGLGLPLTKAFVELHRGHLEIASEYGVGTVVTVHLPPAEDDRLTKAA